MQYVEQVYLIKVGIPSFEAIKKLAELLLLSRDLLRAEQPLLGRLSVEGFLGHSFLIKFCRLLELGISITGRFEPILLELGLGCLGA